MEKSVFKKLDELRKTGSMCIGIDSFEDGYWSVMISQNFGNDEYTFFDECINLEECLWHAVKKLENARRRRLITVC